jgi:4'-phosphopantetheinyl transferase
MPLIFKELKENHALACWKHTEDTAFFEGRISYRSTSSHPDKIKQQLSSRMALFSLDPSFPFELVNHPANGKPFLPSRATEFSLTHTNCMSGAILSRKHAVGIDLERISDRVLNLKSRFLHAEELLMLEKEDMDQISLSTLFWSIKETVFKCFGKTAIDFSNDIRIVSIEKDLSMANIVFHALNDKEHHVFCHKIDDHWLTYMLWEK